MPNESRTVDQRLAEWAKQPGAVVTSAEWDFIAAMRHARAIGVGYGWMQQVIEWEWQAVDAKTAHGPEYYQRELNAARAELHQLRIDAVFATSLRKQVAVMGEKLESAQAELDKAWTTLELCREGRDPGLRDQVKYHKAMATEYRGELSACQAELTEVRALLHDNRRAAQRIVLRVGCHEFPDTLELIKADAEIMVDAIDAAATLREPPEGEE